jgi:flagellar motor switch/type III secretory pathway protein FliN
MATGVAAMPQLPESAANSTDKIISEPQLKAPTPQQNAAEEIRWQPVMALPCLLTVDLPLPGFKVADLLKLRAGSVVGTNWHATRDVPLRINGTLIGWSEFEVVGKQLAARLTELA